jgi:hypothetical protein
MGELKRAAIHFKPGHHQFGDLMHCRFIIYDQHLPGKAALLKDRCRELVVKNQII